MLEQATRDDNYLRHYDLVMYQFERYLNGRALYPEFNVRPDALPIAYFSAE